MAEIRMTCPYCGTVMAALPYHKPAWYDCIKCGIRFPIKLTPAAKPAKEPREITFRDFLYCIPAVQKMRVTYNDTVIVEGTQDVISWLENEGIRKADVINVTTEGDVLLVEVANND